MRLEVEGNLIEFGHIFLEGSNMKSVKFRMNYYQLLFLPAGM